MVTTSEIIDMRIRKSRLNSETEILQTEIILLTQDTGKASLSQKCNGNRLRT